MSATALALVDPDVEPAIERTGVPRQTGDDLFVAPGTGPGAPENMSFQLLSGGIAFAAPGSQMPLPLDSRAKVVEGVVMNVDQTSASVRCRLPNSFVELTLPRAFVPDALAHYGAAVKLAVDTSSPFRRLTVEARQITKPEVDPEIAEIDRWIKTL